MTSGLLLGFYGKIRSMPLKSVPEEPDLLSSTKPEGFLQQYLLWGAAAWAENWGELAVSLSVQESSLTLTEHSAAEGQKRCCFTASHLNFPTQLVITCPEPMCMRDGGRLRLTGDQWGREFWFSTLHKTSALSSRKGRVISSLYDAYWHTIK